MRLLFLSSLIFISASLKAQNSVRNGDRDTCLFRIDVGLNVDFHYMKSSTNENLTSTQNLLLNSMEKNPTSLSLPDIQIILKDKIGLSAGINFMSIATDKKKIENSYAATEKYYYTQLKNNTYESGTSPVESKFSFTMLNIGVVGFIRTYRNLVLLPSINSLINIESNYPEFQIRYKEPNSNYMFTRTYYSENIKAKGLNANLKGRLYFKTTDITRNFGSMFLALNIGYTYMKTSAITSYSDKDIFGDTYYHSKTNVNKDFQSFYIGFSFGFDFHKIDKHR